jgi:Flp pilus assembly protein TadD
LPLLRLKPDFPEYLNGLGVACAGLGDRAAARAQWERVLRLDATNENAGRNLERLAAF